jgi:hypothetical protein
MKKSIIVALFAVILLSSISGSNTASAVLTASIDQKLNILIDNSTSKNISFVYSGVEVLLEPAASLTALSNIRNWELRFSSANSGFMKNPLDESLLYYVQITPASAQGVSQNDLSAYIQLTSMKYIKFTQKTTNAGRTLTMNIRVPETSEVLEGGTDFTDTITITIAASS